jgi:hypothetical protein
MQFGSQKASKIKWHAKFEQFEIAVVGEVSGGFFWQLLSSGSQTVMLCHGSLWPVEKTLSLTHELFISKLHVAHNHFVCERVAVRCTGSQEAEEGWGWGRQLMV